MTWFAHDATDSTLFWLLFFVCLLLFCFCCCCCFCGVFCGFLLLLGGRGGIVFESDLKRCIVYMYIVVGLQNVGL